MKDETGSAVACHGTKDLLDWRVPARYDRWYRLAHVNVNAFVHGKRLDRIVHVHRFFKWRCLGYIQHLDVGNFSEMKTGRSGGARILWSGVGRSSKPD